jgi:hypothetical protein
MYLRFYEDSCADVQPEFAPEHSHFSDSSGRRVECMDNLEGDYSEGEIQKESPPPKVEKEDKSGFVKL